MVYYCIYVISLLLCVLPAVHLKFVQVPVARNLSRAHNYKGTSRHAGSRIVTDDKFNFIARLENSQGDVFSGALVSRTVVLTLASKVEGLTPINIQLGVTSIDTGPAYEVTSADIVTHENFTKGRLEDDIAMIFIPDDTTPRDRNISVRLPSVVQIRAGEKLFNYFPAEVTGWGDKAYPKELRAVTTEILPNNDCTNQRGMNITKTLICTNADSNFLDGPCKNEMGAPLTFLELDEVKTLIGLLVDSYCPVTSPPVYLRITEYIYWMERNGGPVHVFC